MCVNIPSISRSISCVKISIVAAADWTDCLRRFAKGPVKCDATELVSFRLRISKEMTSGRVTSTMHYSFDDIRRHILERSCWHVASDMRLTWWYDSVIL